MLLLVVAAAVLDAAPEAAADFVEFEIEVRKLMRVNINLLHEQRGHPAGAYFRLCVRARQGALPEPHQQDDRYRHDRPPRARFD